MVGGKNIGLSAANTAVDKQKQIKNAERVAQIRRELLKEKLYADTIEYEIDVFIAFDLTFVNRHTPFAIPKRRTIAVNDFCKLFQV